MSLDAKVDEMNNLLHEMKPMLSVCASSLVSLDTRQRLMEIKFAETDVRLTGVIRDLDHLGQKVRMRDRARPVRNGESGSRWIAFLEFLAVLPHYWGAIVVTGSFITTAVVILYKHWPGR